MHHAYPPGADKFRRTMIAPHIRYGTPHLTYGSVLCASQGEKSGLQHAGSVHNEQIVSTSGRQYQQATTVSGSCLWLFAAHGIPAYGASCPTYSSVLHTSHSKYLIHKNNIYNRQFISFTDHVHWQHPVSECCTWHPMASRLLCMVCCSMPQDHPALHPKATERYPMR